MGADRVPVTHFGPALDCPGGMSSLLRNYAKLPLRRYRFAFVTTYHPRSRFWSLWPLLGGLWLLVSRSRARLGIAHFHLSKGGSFIREGLLLVAASWRGLHTCVTLHSGGVAGFLRRHPRLVRRVLGRTDRVLVLEREAAEELLRITGISAAGVLPNTVEAPRIESWPGECPPRVLFAGNVSTAKGVDVLLAAWPSVRRHVPGAELTIAGPLQDIEIHALPGVRFLGSVPSADVRRLLWRSRLAVLPSRREGMPMFVLEAMAHGRPVVATSSGATAEILGDGGIAVPVGDAAALAEALTRFLLDPEGADRAGRAARLRIEAEYGFERAGGRLEALYDSVNEHSAVPAGRAVGGARRHAVFGTVLDALAFDETLRRVEEIVDRGNPNQHVALNAAKVVALQRDGLLRDIIRTSGVVSADGMSVVWAARLLGIPVPERVTGIDLMHAILALAGRRRWRVYFFGAGPEVAGAVARWAAEAHPGLQVAGHRDGYFADEEGAAIASEIARSRADVLLVAFSSPRKEYWVHRHLQELGVPFCMGVGGSFDVVAGLRKRAPLWMRRLGLEWSFRLLQEPRRLWRRYLVQNARFVWIVAAELLRAAGKEARPA